jgi:uncharacterized surface protein with fasciclin (FAS1) repeats
MKKAVTIDAISSQKHTGMENLVFINSLKVTSRKLIVILLSVAWMFPSCLDSDDVGGSFYTFKGQMMGEYLRSQPDLFSEFTKMLDTTGVMGMLNAYGTYTCFAPTNEAVLTYYHQKGHASIHDFPLDSIKKVVFDHLIKGEAIPSSEFINGRISSVTMNERYLSTLLTIEENGLPAIYVNETAPIIMKDILVHNGIIQTVGQLLQPTDLKLTEMIGKDKKFTLFYTALVATGLNTELEKVKDNSYIYSPTTLADHQVPLTRKYGYTALLESDSVFKKNGINTLEQLKTYARLVYDQVYPDDAGISDIKDRKNSLNRFIAYHLINKQINYRKFIYDFDNDGVVDPTKTHSIKTYDMYEYIETLCPNTLMEVRTNRETNESYGVFNMINATKDGIRINAKYKDKDALNGVYHEIDKLLTYSSSFAVELSTKRLRMDASSFFPEFTNNNMRSSKVTVRWVVPRGYLERLTQTELTTLIYLNADDRYMDYQGDEIFANSTNLFDFTLTTPPIPAGTYEVRFGYFTNGKRGTAQLYWDGKPCGIPLDLNISSDQASIGYKTPGSETTDPYGFENDKMMHNRGYMKGPASFGVIDHVWYSQANARLSPQALRRVIGTFTFNEDGHHTFGAKAAKLGEFMFDFLEFVPTEALEKEGID